MGVSAQKVGEILVEAVETTKEKLGHFTDIDLICSACGREAGLLGDDFDVERTAALVEHSQHEHVSPGDVIISTRWRLMSAYEISRALGLPARTEHEERWRSANPI